MEDTLEQSHDEPLARGGVLLSPSRYHGKSQTAMKGARGRFGCKTCRQRHLKCDETHPVCNRCNIAKRQCHWNHELRLSHDTRSASYNLSEMETPSHQTQSHWIPDVGPLIRARRDSSGDYVANTEWATGNILGQPLEASLFKFYIEHTGPWLDVTSPSRHFGMTIPRLATSNPVLLYACLSYASKVMLPSSSLCEQYAGACIELLIPLLSDEVFVSTDETLLATLVILRHVEQYAEVPEDKGAHLSGAFGIIVSQKVFPPHDSLPGAALWTYMRQDIRQAILNRRAPKLVPNHNLQIESFNGMDTTGTSVWADRACLLAALACTFAWSENIGEVDGDQLEEQLNWWRDSIPDEYSAYHASGPVLQYLAPWHVVGWHFYHLARMILKLYNTTRPRDMDIIHFNAQIERDVLEHARAICNITYSTNDTGCRFNASAMLGFAGTYFKMPEDQQPLLDFMNKFSQETKWPTHTDQERLQNIWRSAQEPKT